MDSIYRVAWFRKIARDFDRSGQSHNIDFWEFAQRSHDKLCFRTFPEDRRDSTEVKRALQRIYTDEVHQDEVVGDIVSQNPSSAAEAISPNISITGHGAGVSNQDFVSSTIFDF